MPLSILTLPRFALVSSSVVATAAAAQNAHMAYKFNWSKMLLQNSPILVSVAIAAKAKEKNAKWENGKMEKCEKVAHSINQREFVVRLKCAYSISFTYTWQIHTYIHLYPHMVGIQMGL